VPIAVREARCFFRGRGVREEGYSWRIVLFGCESSFNLAR